MSSVSYFGLSSLPANLQQLIQGNCQNTLGCFTGPHTSLAPKSSRAVTKDANSYIYSTSISTYLLEYYHYSIKPNSSIVGFPGIHKERSS